MTVRQRGGFLRGGAASLAACGVLATGMSFLGSHGFFFELLSHFRVHLAGGTVLLMLVAAAARHWTATVAAALAAAANVIPLLPYAASPAADVRSGTPVRVMAANLHGPFVDRDAVELLVERERPDVVVLTEVDPSFAKSLAKMAAWLPHRVDGQAGSIFETFVLSRWPIAVRASERAVPWAPVNAYRICPNPAEPLGCFDLVASHPPPPVQPNAMRLRDRTLQAAARLARESSARWQILAGDLNVTAWSPVFADVLQSSALRDASLGHGLRPTWPTTLPGWLGIRIDHILVSAGIRVAAFRVGPHVGSDHLPAIADLVLTD